MLRMDNGGGVLGDVSYLAPDGCGYAAPQYWRVTCHGAAGAVEASLAGPAVLLASAGDKAVRQVEPDPPADGSPLASFLREVTGRGGEVCPSTSEVLEAARIALIVQRAADEGRANVPL